MSAHMITPKVVEVALKDCDTGAFEDYAQTVFGAYMGPKFKPLGGHKDGGADGFLAAGLYEDVKRPTHFFQASKQIDFEKKIRDTVKRLQEVGRQVEHLYYVTSIEVPAIDKFEYDLSEELSVQVRIYDKKFCIQRANFNGDTVAAFHQYLYPAVQPLLKELAPSYPHKAVIENARAVCAFLGQEMERELGTEKTLETVCDALILWSLEETDPNQQKFLTEEEIVDKVENTIPSAKKIFSRSSQDPPCRPGQQNRRRRPQDKLLQKR